ncbi:MAG: RNA methyltransferase [Deltaproteobacteria bacterium]|nr:RNA methyltransferase [Deltaproteobacteria bacterium]
MTVKYRRKISSDVFTPTRQSEKEQLLARKDPRRVCEILGKMMTDERRATIDNVVANRTQMLHVAIEGVHDPHNTAAIIRSADAFGIQNIHIIEGATRFKSSAAVTQGAHKWVDVHVYADTSSFLEKMRDQQMRVFVAAMDGAVAVANVDITTPLVLVFGNEAEGISAQMRAGADGAFRIPMFGFVESFNVSVAAGITIAMLRQHGGGDLSEPERDILVARYYLRSVRAGYDIVNRLQ